MALCLKANHVVDGSPSELVLESGQIVIGRLPSSHLRLSGSGVEPIHAMVEVDPDTGDTSLVDMASDNGVLLNGRRLDVIAKLKAGDVIQVGNVTIEVTSAVAEPTPEKTQRKDRTGSGQTRIVPEDESTQRLDLNTQQQSPEGASEEFEAEQDREREKKKKNRVVHHQIFQPGKERPSGSTLEVVAFWESTILDVRHYGGHAAPDEAPRPSVVVIGNEEDDHLIGVGPNGDTRNLRLAEVSDNVTVIYLNRDMRARVRRGGNFEKIDGPAKFRLSSKEIALVKHGPVNYFFMNVSLPKPTLRQFEDPEGKTFIWYYFLALYMALLLFIVLIAVPHSANNKPAENDIWSVVAEVRTLPPTPKPQLPSAKVEVTLPPSKPAETKPVEAKPAATQPPKPPVQSTPPKTLVKPANTPPPQPQAGAKSQLNPNAKDSGLGPQNSNKDGNSGSKSSSAPGPIAGQRAGEDKVNTPGSTTGTKPSIGFSNFDKLGAGFGKTSDLSGPGAINTGLVSSAGGEGRGQGTGPKGAMGLGGMGQGNSLASGGTGGALSGIGGEGGGGLGKGGVGGAGGAGGKGTGRVSQTRVEVPEGDPVVEGSLTKEEIFAVINANISMIKACYEQYLQGKRDLGGKVKVHWIILPTGRVGTTKIVEDSTGYPPLLNCIQGKIVTWKFPLPRGGGQVNTTYPFVFNQAGR